MTDRVTGPRRPSRVVDGGVSTVDVREGVEPVCGRGPGVDRGDGVGDSTIGRVELLSDRDTGPRVTTPVTVSTGSASVGGPVPVRTPTTEPGIVRDSSRPTNPGVPGGPGLVTIQVTRTGQLLLRSVEARGPPYT